MAKKTRHRSTKRKVIKRKRRTTTKPKKRYTKKTKTRHPSRSGVSRRRHLSTAGVQRRVVGLSSLHGRLKHVPRHVRFVPSFSY